MLLHSFIVYLVLSLSLPGWKQLTYVVFELVGTLLRLIEGPAFQIFFLKVPSNCSIQLFDKQKSSVNVYLYHSIFGQKSFFILLSDKLWNWSLLVLFFSFCWTQGSSNLKDWVTKYVNIAYLSIFLVFFVVVVINCKTFVYLRVLLERFFLPSSSLRHSSKFLLHFHFQIFALFNSRDVLFKTHTHTHTHAHKKIHNFPDIYYRWFFLSIK